MPKKRIFTVGFDLPGDEFEYIRFDSDRSLLDADIVLFHVGFGGLDANDDYQGTPLFDKFTSPKVGQYLAHWRSELPAFVNAGKLAIVYVTKPLQYFRYTGEQTFSGTGRSRVTTNLVNPISSYAAVPAIEQVTGKTGREVKLTADAAYLAPYWKELSPHSDYEAFIEGKFTHRVLVTKNGDKTVGAALRGKGSLLFLPPLHLDDERFLKYDSNGTFWTAEALKLGKRLVVALGALADALKLTSPTPPPVWAQDPNFTTIEESQLQTSIAKVTKELDRLSQKCTSLEQQLNEAGKLRGLLYETGSALEHSVREALALFGFAAKRHSESDSEFDVIFESAEGRLIGEIEGKDSRAINIDKLSQLERNLHEDFARDNVTEFAKGVLFGNPERLVALEERKEAFTAKCVSGARRAGIALVRTADMFAPARYLRETKDMEFAAECRKAIRETVGDVVVFPNPPVSHQPERVTAE